MNVVILRVQDVRIKVSVEINRDLEGMTYKISKEGLYVRVVAVSSVEVACKMAILITIIMHEIIRYVIRNCREPSCNIDVILVVKVIKSLVVRGVQEIIFKI